ncbi:DbpA RNA binding domain-containing protein, partial [Myxococcota bacterium]|nr:DbpA RNA binding domain-containing protein [Myxococcota bacterium]
DRAERGERGGRDSRRGRERDRGRTRGGNEDRPWAASSRSGDDHQGSNRNDNFETFEVTTGEEFGANAHRLMAMACRRGDVGRQDIGAIKLGGKTSLIEVSTRVAEAFAAASSKRDARDRDVHFNPISYKPKSDRKPEYKTDRKPSYKSDRKPEYKTDRKPEYKSDRKPEYKSESKHSGEDDIWRTDDNRGENRGERSERKGGRNHRGTSDANPKGRWRKQEGQVETRGGNDSEGKERVTNSWRTRGGRSQDTRGGGFAPPRRREKGSVAPRRSR